MMLRSPHRGRYQPRSGAAFFSSLLQYRALATSFAREGKRDVRAR
jgi:hypothetical protein